MGNRTKQIESKDGQSPVTTTYSYNARDQLVSETDGTSTIEYEYDSNGSLVMQTGRTQTWDLRGRLAGATVGSTTTSYRYTPDGIRSSVTEGSTTIDYIIDGMTPSGYQQVVEETAGGVLAVRYTYGASLDPISEMRGGTSSLYLGDGHSGVRQAIDLLGAVVLAQRFDAFGMSVSKVGTLNTAIGYRGERFDATLGQYYLRARYYDPRSGRFSGVDPIGETYKDPSQLLRYSYAGNNSIANIDPSGQFLALAAIAGIGVMAGIRAANASGKTGIAAVAIGTIVGFAAVATLRLAFTYIVSLATTERRLTSQEAKYYSQIFSAILSPERYASISISGLTVEQMLSDVRLHDSVGVSAILNGGGALAALNLKGTILGLHVKEPNANAITLGNDIYFVPGKFPTDSSAPNPLLGHELMHSMQSFEPHVFRSIPSEDWWMIRYIAESYPYAYFNTKDAYYGNGYELEGYAVAGTIAAVAAQFPGLFNKLGDGGRLTPVEQAAVKQIYDAHLQLEQGKWL